MKLKKSAFSLVEMLVAIAISGIVITAAFGVVGQMYFSQKRINVAQNFYDESRFLMERLTQLVRNNTIDYDGMFKSVGPACSFDKRQTPNFGGGDHSTLNYPDIFYWNLGTPDEPLVRNLGGVKPGGDDKTPDPCTEAWDTSKTLHGIVLIDAARTTQNIFLLKDDRIILATLLGGDSNNDGINDIWGYDATHAAPNCTIKDTTTLATAVTEDSDGLFCAQAHDFIAISPGSFKITDLKIIPTPTRDPYLAWRVDGAQAQPSVFISFTAKLKDCENYGFDATKCPEITLQTTASSRVYGNTRGQ